MATAGPMTIGHTRLAIQDLSGAPSQPVTVGSTVVSFNGEGWRPDQLRKLAAEHGHDGHWRSTGDTEPIAWLLDRLGVNLLPYLVGMFALAWARDGQLYLARDAYGEVPLHYGYTPEGALVYASEIGPLLHLGAVPSSVRWVPPGHVLHLFDHRIQVNRWHCPVAPPAQVNPAKHLRELLSQGVSDRSVSDAPVAVLASGGLDSTAIMALLALKVPNLVAYIAVHDRQSADLRHAEILCKHLDIPLVQVPVPSPTAADLARVVGTIEMPHKAQIEIGYACGHLGRAMAKDGIRVVLSGEGSDELFASYGMSYHGIKAKGWDGYRRETFTGQHRKNFARTNKVFMRHGIEARLPFLHPELVAYALTLTQAQVTNHQGRRHVKAVLAGGFPELPQSSIWRSKVAFQTGQRLDDAAAAVIHDPARFYRAEYIRHFRKVAP